MWNSHQIPKIMTTWPHACCISSNHTTNHTRESYHESYPWFWSHVLKHAGYHYGIGKSWWSLFCGSKLGAYVYLLACRPCLSRYGRSQGCQTMSPEWPSTQDVHLFVLYLTKLCPSTLFLQKQSPARIIPRIIPDTYPESYPNLALLCHGPVGPFRKQPQSPAWCRREPFDIGYSLYVDSKEGGANHTPNHTSETYLETYLRIIPPMQHALLTTEFSYTAIYTYIYVYIYIIIYYWYFSHFLKHIFTYVSSISFHILEYIFFLAFLCRVLFSPLDCWLWHRRQPKQALARVARSARRGEIATTCLLYGAYITTNDKHLNILLSDSSSISLKQIKVFQRHSHKDFWGATWSRKREQVNHTEC